MLWIKKDEILRVVAFFAFLLSDRRSYIPSCEGKALPSGRTRIIQWSSTRDIGRAFDTFPRHVEASDSLFKHIRRVSMPERLDELSFPPDIRNDCVRGA